MSTRAMSRLPLFNGGGSAGIGYAGMDDSGGGLSGLLAALTGQNQTTGGLTTDASGKLSWTPVQATHPKGLFAGAARRSANLQNLAIGPQVMQNQAALELQKLINEHENAFAKLQSDLQNELANNTHIRELAKTHGVTVDALTKELAPKLTALASQKLDNQIAANNPAKNPDVTANSNIGANMEANRLPPQLLMSKAGPNELSTTPAIPGVNTPSGTPSGLIQTAGALQNQNVVTDQFGMMHNILSNIPGSTSFPVNPKIKADALNINPSVNTSVQDNGMTLPDLMKLWSQSSGALAAPQLNSTGTSSLFPSNPATPVNNDLSSFLTPSNNTITQPSVTTNVAPSTVTGTAQEPTSQGNGIQDVLSNLPAYLRYLTSLIPGNK